jgi:uncharacterized iron-regulated membrane protein
MSFWYRWLRQPQTLWLRKALFQVHLWSGVGIGLYIVAISVSGTVLIYRSELRQLFDPQPQIVAVTGARLSADDLTAAAERLYPDHRVSIFQEPDDQTLAVTITVDPGGAAAQMFFDPYTGENLGYALPAGWRFTTWLLDFHDNLLGGDTGRHVNGVGSILLTLLALTGAVIWWPGISSWRRSLTVDWRANWRRMNWTIHSAIGVWTVLFVLMWGVTGIYLAFPEPFTAFVDYVEPMNMETFEERVGDRVLYWLAYAHFGRFGGMTTKIVWTVIGLAPPVMFVTGAVMWWNRVLRPQGPSTRSGN